MTFDANNRLIRWQDNVISAKNYACTYHEIDNCLADTGAGVVRIWTIDVPSRPITKTSVSVTKAFTYAISGNKFDVSDERESYSGFNFQSWSFLLCHFEEIPIYLLSNATCSRSQVLRISELQCASN